jgi:hypothetical protein
LLSLIALLADLLDLLCHQPHDLIGIFVGVPLPDLFDNLPESLSIFRLLLFDPPARLRNVVVHY